MVKGGGGVCKCLPWVEFLIVRSVWRGEGEENGGSGVYILYNAMRFLHYKIKMLGNSNFSEFTLILRQS